MASSLSDHGEILAALAAIPNNLRGITWLTIPQLALVANVSVASLNAVLAPLNADHSTLTMLKIEKTKWRPTKLSKNVYYFRPYTDITSQVSNSMRENEE